MCSGEFENTIPNWMILRCPSVDVDASTQHSKIFDLAATSMNDLENLTSSSNRNIEYLCIFVVKIRQPVMELSW